MTWKLDLGANFTEKGAVSFKVWAPHQELLKLKLYRDHFPDPIVMEKDPDGYFQAEVEGVQTGDRYNFVFANGTARPDPASRYQPEGVHGPSEIIDPSAFQWSDMNWEGISLKELIFYECHTGCFSEKGTFAGIIEKLPYLRDLGITCLEIMPIAQFPGRWNWGYDGANIYAPQTTYGGPQGFKELVNACHQQGIAVCLDVVYNHLGPEGNYLEEYGPYFSGRYLTQWGRTFNYDGAYSDYVRHYIIQNALYWIEEYHIDVLRLDAIHGIFDFSKPPFLQELAQTVAQQAKQNGREIHVTAETDQNDAQIVKPKAKGGYGIHSQWSDDFHHALHVCLTGEQQEHYIDFQDLADLAKALSQGFVYDGAYSMFRKRRHGTESGDLPFERFIVFAQNHDQVGNRPFGDRLTTNISFAAEKMIAVILLLSPYLPLIFMGQEYGEKAPFQFFVDYDDKELLEKVVRSKIEENEGLNGPLPGQEAFEDSRLSWQLDDQNNALLALYRTLIELRKQETCFQHLKRKELKIHHSSENRWIGWEMRPSSKETLAILCNFNTTPLSIKLPFSKACEWQILLNTDSSDYKGFSEISFSPEQRKITLPPQSSLVFKGQKASS